MCNESEQLASLVEIEFPDVPLNYYMTAPVYLEPMRGSGELVTVAGIIKDGDQHHVEPIITLEIAQKLYGDRGAEFIGRICTVLKLLKIELKFNALCIDNPTTCVSSIKLGPAIKTYADDVQDALEQIAILHSSFWVKPVDKKDY